MKQSFGFAYEKPELLKFDHMSVVSGAEVGASQGGDNDGDTGFCTEGFVDA